MTPPQELINFSMISRCILVTAYQSDVDAPFVHPAAKVRNGVRVIPHNTTILERYQETSLLSCNIVDR